MSALADPLGPGEGHTFGWLQILGVVLGAVILLLGLVIATEWVSLPGRRNAAVTGTQNTTVVEGSAAPPPPAEAPTQTTP